MTIDIHWNTIGQVLASWDNPFILENMGDSPLSITASVTGILTFVAAILAFIYVRYLTLRNSKDEMNSILISVTASIGETNRVRASIQSAEARALHGRGQRISAADTGGYIDTVGNNHKGLVSG
jgi:hypothetical protein